MRELTGVWSCWGEGHCLSDVVLKEVPFELGFETHRGLPRGKDWVVMGTASCQKILSPGQHEPVACTGLPWCRERPDEK